MYCSFWKLNIWEKISYASINGSPHAHSFHLPSSLESKICAFLTEYQANEKTIYQMRSYGHLVLTLKIMNQIAEKIYEHALEIL